MSLLNDVALRKIVEWVNGKLLHKADKSHTHTIANVNSLQSTLDSKAATNHTHSAASSTTNGFLSKEDKVKLDGIEAGANKFTMPSKLLHTIIDFGATGISFFTPEIKRSIDNSIATKADAKHTHMAADIVENEEKKFVSQAWLNEQESLYSAAGERLTEVEAKADANALGLTGKANSSHNHNLATQSAAGFLSAGDKTKIDGIPSAPKYTDTTYALATTSTAGLLSNTDKIKLDAIPANPKYTDTNTITTINGKTGAITKADIVALGIPSTDTNTTYSPVTTTTDGLMLATDKAKLDSVPTNAKYTDTITTINGKTGAITKADIVALGIPAQDTVVDISGKADKTYVDNKVKTDVPVGAKFTDTVYTHPDSHPASMITGLPTSLPANGGNADTVGGFTVGVNVPANAKFTDTNTTYSEISTAEIDAGTASSGRTITGRRVQYILDKISSMISVAIGALTKSSVGLGNVDNTSDANKPISTATQTALNGKVNNSQVLTNVPSGAKFTDTVTTINGKTGAITKADIVALGIPATDTNTVYTHPANHPASIITQDANNRFVTDAEKSAWNNKANASHTHTIANITNLQTELDKRAGVDGKTSGPWQIGKKIYNVANCLFAGTPTEILIKTGIPFISGAHMPVVHIEGYAYGLQSPIELKIGYYVYDNQHGWTGAVSMGAWRPTIKLFTYLVGTTKYTGIALIGSIYFPQFAVHVHTEKGESYRDGWSITSNSSDNTVYHMPDTDVYTIPYKATFSQKINGVTFDGTSDITITASANGGNSDTVDGKHASDFALASQVKTNVPVNAKFTDTITTINGKTGAITKADITALGIPAQDTVYTHPNIHPASMITESTTRRFVTDNEKFAWNSKVDKAGGQMTGELVAQPSGNTRQVRNIAIGTTAPTSTTGYSEGDIFLVVP